MQLHTFMLGIDVARRALLLISTPPCRYFRRGEACAKAKNLYPVWSDDTIWNMLGQLCSMPSGPQQKPNAASWSVCRSIRNSCARVGHWSLDSCFKQLRLARPVSGMYGNLCWRQLEDQPAIASVDPCKSKHVT